jgi:DNA-binding response OmpR family regulator
MTGEPDLGGVRILVVGDDYYLATDAARALRGAGAEVLGPCSAEEEARDVLARQRPDAVLLDINLGPGPTFKLAETLKDNGIPFVSSPTTIRMSSRPSLTTSNASRSRYSFVNWSTWSPGF